jgi:probable F420-dependent oxidoreductase
LFHEPLVLFAYLAGITEKLEFVTGVIILPQRQTALVAKQAAELDVLSGGRLRLGVGIGWNDVEYEGLNENFRNRGRRFEEQIEVLRLLWTQPVVDFHGQFHNITEAGIKPLPVQRPIPLWIGANVEAGVERAGRVADGYFPQVPPDERGRHMVEVFRTAAEQAGRDPNSLGIEARISLSQGGPDDWRRLYEGWRDLGATHISVNTMGMGLPSPGEHIMAIERFKREVVEGR